MNYNYTNDRFIDHAIQLWVNYMDDKYDLGSAIEDLSYHEKEFNKLYYDIGLESFIDYVFENYPICAEIPNCDYDVKYTWEEFQNESRKNYQTALDIITFINDSVKIDNDVVNEYIDDDLICESYSGSDKLEEFFTKNKIGKRLYLKDKKAMRLAFEEGICVEFENGYSWSPSEFAYVVMSDDDTENHTVKDLHEYVKNHRNDNDRLVFDCEIYNSRLSKSFGGKDVYTCFEINLEDIAKNADLKATASKKVKTTDYEDEILPF